MADAPWIKWVTADFLTEVADLQADEIGVYAVIKNLMADRGGPIEDDGKWLARRCGTSTRRFNQIRAKLLAIPGLLIVRDGMLGHSKMLAAIDKRDGKSQQARTAAMTRWHRASEPELPLANGGGDAPTRARAHGQPQEPAEFSGKSGETSREQNVLISRSSGQKPQETANSDDADASAPCARARSKNQEARITSRPDPAELTLASGRVDAPPPDRLNDLDLHTLFEAVCEASGHRPISPTQIDRAFRIVEEWRKAGFDFDVVVLPTIKAVTAEAREPTRTLGRFTAQIAHEHARLKARGEAGRAYAPPISPVLDIPGEEPTMREIRTDLLKAVGAQAYCRSANTTQLQPVHDAGRGRTPIRVTGPPHAVASLVDGDTGSALRAIAKRHGFSEVWSA